MIPHYILLCGTYVVNEGTKQMIMFGLWHNLR